MSGRRGRTKKKPIATPRMGVWAVGAGTWRTPWRDAMELLRDAVDRRGEICITCGAVLLKSTSDETGRTYCSDECASVLSSQRGRYRRFLKQRGEPCPACGEHVT